MPTNYEPLVLTIEPAYVGSAVSPTVDITETSEDVTVTITDINGEHSYTVEKTDQAIADAEAAASAANNAASAASTAATRANTSADNADAATTAANSAAANANAAAGRVDTAIDDAESAATAANSAATGATNAASAANSAASNANAKATLADTAASNANTKAGLADTAANAANTAAQSASSAASTATTAANNADAKATAANTAASAANTAAAAADAAREAIQNDLAAKANKDGLYPLLSAGTSDALLSGDSALATFARRVSDHDGACRIESLRGRTVVWNQQIQPKTYSTSGMLFTTSPDGTITASGGNTSDSVKYPQPDEVVTVTEGHKCLMIVTGLNDSVSLTGNVRFSGVAALGWAPNSGTLSNGTLKYMATLSGSGTMTPLSFRVEPGATLDFSCKVMFYDLTAMFGAGNEPATVAEFESMFPDAYYPYNAGELVSVNIEGVKAVGFNQWDEEWENGGYNNRDGSPTTNLNYIRTKNPIPVFPNTQYYLKGGTYYVYFYDEDDGYITYKAGQLNTTITTPSNARLMRFCDVSHSTYNHEICINISDPALNGTYRPYTEQTREIPAATYFPEGMRSAGSVYDELMSDKAITRIGSRAYQSGDESDTSVITDGTTTYYALSTPVVVNIEPPLNLVYPTEQGGTEYIVVPTGEQSAPPTMAVVYAYDANGIVDKSQSIVAPVEGARASANYSVGSYLVHDGTLYRVTTAIATGEAINPGGNATATTVMAELIRLTA